MRLKTREQLNPTEAFLAADPEKRQLYSMELNADEAAVQFKQLPWAKVLITPTRIFLRD